MPLSVPFKLTTPASRSPHGGETIMGNAAGKAGAFIYVNSSHFFNLNILSFITSITIATYR
ncbi:hypothetical protein IIC38_14500 [candidate division KSB1 bacterium]|nr:hypothetical protein [candidate division KSB1 bacterium]